VVTADVEKGSGAVGLITGEEELRGPVDEADLPVAVENENRVFDFIEECFLEFPLSPLRVTDEGRLANGVAEGVRVRLSSSAPAVSAMANSRTPLRRRRNLNAK
jgi:hypothetical protein